MDTPFKSIFARALVTKKIILPVSNIGKNINRTFETYLKANYEGKCQVDGYIRPKSCTIISHSCGTILEGNKVSFDVIFDCYLCFPVEGMLIECIAKNISNAGIECESNEYVPSPVVVYLTKEHHQGNKYFNSIKEGDKVIIKVIGQRFELNDPYVSVIGELSKPLIQKLSSKTDTSSRKNKKIYKK